MLSVCIPVYNFDMTQLVQGLARQAGCLDTDVEILLLDDDSDIFFKKINRKLASLPHVVYEELETNLGRSKIRNLLGKMAKHQHLLFLDCDSEAPDNLYLKRYILHLEEKNKTHGNEAAITSNKEAPGSEAVIYGGRCYRESHGNADKKLHWLFGTIREVKDAETRSLHPYQSFMTNNFLTTKSVISKIPFHEQLHGYGHEDTLFGYELKKNGVPIIHINNPLIHIGLETADQFLIKTEQGLKNLLKINDHLEYDPEFIKMVRVLSTCYKLRRYHLITPFNNVFNLFEKSIRHSLLGASPKLWQLDLFKLGMIARAGSEVGG